MQFSGVYAVLPTPFDPRGDVYASKVSSNVTRLSDTSLSGFVVGGREGEGALLAEHERLRLWELVKAAAKDRMVLPAIDAAGVRAAVHLIEQAAEMGFEAVVVGTACGQLSDLTSPETRGIFFASIADRSPLPLVISVEDRENLPRLPPQQLATLARRQNIAGLRLMTPDVAYLRDSVQACSGHADVIVGSMDLLAEGLIAGAIGAMLGFASAAPYICLSIEEAARTREFQAARDLQTVADSAIDVIRRHGVPALKFAADLKGYYGGMPRLPLSPLGPAAKAEIEAAFQDIKS